MMMPTNSLGQTPSGIQSLSGRCWPRSGSSFYAMVDDGMRALTAVPVLVPKPRTTYEHQMGFSKRSIRSGDSGLWALLQ